MVCAAGGKAALLSRKERKSRFLLLGDIVGRPTFQIDLSKVVAVVQTDAADRNSPFKPLDDDSKAIAGHLLDFFDTEVTAGRMPQNLFPLQSGVGNIANAVLAGLLDSHYENLTSYTEVIQDGMIDLIDAGKITTFGQDRRGAEALMDRLHDVAAQGAGLVITTHDMELAADHADRVLILAQGTVHYEIGRASCRERV